VSQHHDNLKLTIYSPERKIAERVDIRQVTLPTSEGQIQILPGHAAMIGQLVTGAFEYELRSGEKARGFVSTGFFEVADGQVYLTPETAELSGDIDVSRAAKAQAKAEQVLKSSELDSHSFRKYQLKLERALVRQQIGK
jgi:F-type H+-transporting ATPase subunit epsilon